MQPLTLTLRVYVGVLMIHTRVGLDPSDTSFLALSDPDWCEFNESMEEKSCFLHIEMKTKMNEYT